MIPMAKWQMPKIAKQDMWNQQNLSEDMTRERWDVEIHEKYTTTWTISDGNIRRQIVYIMINAKRRNVTRKTQTNCYWTSNKNQKPTAPSTDIAALLQRGKETQEADTIRNSSKNKI